MEYFEMSKQYLVNRENEGKWIWEEFREKENNQNAMCEIPKELKKNIFERKNLVFYNLKQNMLYVLNTLCSF